MHDYLHEDHYYYTCAYAYMLVVVAHACGRRCAYAGLGRESGLPIGLQLVGPEFSDMITIDVARLLRDECGFDCVRPPLLAQLERSKAAAKL